MHTKNNNTIVFPQAERVRINGRAYWYTVDKKEGIVQLCAENEFRYEYIDLDLGRYMDMWDLRVGYEGDQEILLEDENVRIGEWEIADLILYALNDEGYWSNKYSLILDLEIKTRQELDLEWYRARFIRIADNVLRRKYKFKKQRQAYCALLWRKHYQSIK